MSRFTCTSIVAALALAACGGGSTPPATPEVPAAPSAPSVPAVPAVPSVATAAVPVAPPASAAPDFDGTYKAVRDMRSWKDAMKGATDKLGPPSKVVGNKSYWYGPWKSDCGEFVVERAGADGLGMVGTQTSDSKNCKK